MTSEQIAVQFEHQEQEIKSLKHRMDNCEEQQSMFNKMVNSVDRLAINMEYMAKEQKEQGERLSRLEREPADDYKHYKRLIIGCILTGLIGAIVGAILTTILI